jgi:ribonuclease P protein component
MLPKRFRLTRSRDFTRVRRAGRKAGSNLLALRALDTRSPDLRIGFTASKKVGKATVRNRVKRRMREAVRSRLTQIRSGQDLIFIAHPPAAEASYHEIDESVAYVLRKSRALAGTTEPGNA